MKRALALLLAGTIGVSAAVLPAATARGASKDKGKGAGAADLIPPDAQWTITCQVFSGPNRMSDAKRAKEYWAARTGLPGFYVVHESQQSTLYYGYYRSIDPNDKNSDNARARTDRAMIDGLVAPNGDRPFHGCVFMPLVTKDPPAPPEWNLANSKGYWSLQVAVYKDDPRAKQYAVDSVRDMRAHGIEAYYFHGPTSSMVCIGSWPRDAVREQESSVAKSADPNQPILVSPEPLTNQTIYQRQTGQKIKQMAPKVEILDKTLADAMKKYPDLAVNGAEKTTTATDDQGRQVEIPLSSYLVLVPEKQQTQEIDGAPVPPPLTNPTNGQQQLPSAFLPPEPPKSRDGASKLRGFDGN